jgi:hypothetical protein
MIILVHRNVVYNIFVLVCVSNEIQVQHEANRAGGVFLRELPAAHIICFCTGKQKNCRNNIPFTDFYRLLPTCTDFYLKHFVGFQCDAGSAALNTHPKANGYLEMTPFTSILVCSWWTLVTRGEIWPLQRSRHEFQFCNIHRSQIYDVY